MQSLKITGTKAYCFDPKYRKYMRMGTVIGDVFFKTVEAKHFMKIVNGYGLQYDAFAQFVMRGVKKIEVLERHTGNTWLSDVVTWTVHGKVADYGRGKQIFLSLKYMALVDKKRQLERERKDAKKRADTIQKSLL